MQISRSRFKQSKIPLLIPHIYVLFCLVIFIGYVWTYLGLNSFFQWNSKFDGNGKLGRSHDVLKLEFEVKNW